MERKRGIYDFDIPVIKKIKVEEIKEKTFYSLPKEIMKYIFSFIGVEQFLYYEVQLVCKKFHKNFSQMNLKIKKTESFSEVCSLYNEHSIRKATNNLLNFYENKNKEGKRDIELEFAEGMKTIILSNKFHLLEKFVKKINIEKRYHYLISNCASLGDLKKLKELVRILQPEIFFIKDLKKKHIYSRVWKKDIFDYLEKTFGEKDRVKCSDDNSEYFAAIRETIRNDGSIEFIKFLLKKIDFVIEDGEDEDEFADEVCIYYDRQECLNLICYKENEVLLDLFLPYGYRNCYSLYENLGGNVKLAAKIFNHHCNGKNIYNDELEIIDMDYLIRNYIEEGNFPEMLEFLVKNVKFHCKDKINLDNYIEICLKHKKFDLLEVLIKEGANSSLEIDKILKNK